MKVSRTVSSIGTRACMSADERVLHFMIDTQAISHSHPTQFGTQSSDCCTDCFKIIGETQQLLFMSVTSASKPNMVEFVIAFWKTEIWLPLENFTRASASHRPYFVSYQLNHHFRLSSQHEDTGKTSYILLTRRHPSQAYPMH